jgi:hypothetical protein
LICIGVVVVLLLQLHMIFLCNKDLLLGLDRVVIHGGLSCLGVEAYSGLGLSTIAVGLDQVGKWHGTCCLRIQNMMC